jgi:hypothetical protein
MWLHFSTHLYLPDCLPDFRLIPEPAKAEIWIGVIPNDAASP